MGTDLSADTDAASSCVDWTDLWVCRSTCKTVVSTAHWESNGQPLRKRRSKLNVSKSGTVTQITFLDASICIDADLDQIRSEIFHLIDAVKQPKLLLSFENVTELSSAALGVLIRIHQRIGKLDGQLRMAPVKPQIQEIFTITNLHGVFRICADSQEAVDSFD